jgi:hypothetical protein
MAIKLVTLMLPIRPHAERLASCLGWPKAALRTWLPMKRGQVCEERTKRSIETYFP